MLDVMGPQVGWLKKAYIAEFDRMEAELHSRQAPAIDLDGNATLRRILLGKLDCIDVPEAKVEEMAQALALAHQFIEHGTPKVEAYQALMDDPGTCCLANVARHIGALKEAFLALLHKAKIVFDKGGDAIPKAKYRADGSFVVKLTRLSRNRHAAQTRVTRQGPVWLTDRWTVKRAVAAHEAAAARIKGILL